MLLHLDIMKMVKLVALVLPSDVVVSFNVKMTRTNMKLPNGDPKSMYIVLKCVGGLNNKVITQL